MTASTRERSLVLLRHAKAEPLAESDEARPLALLGREQASLVGRALAQTDPIDLALVSGALRTRQTWDLLAAAFEVPPRSEIVPALYHANPRAVIDLLREVEGATRVLVVGHEPVMSSLAAILAGPDSDEALTAQVRLGVPTATWSDLGVPVPWAELDRGSATLRAVNRPES